MNNIRYENAEEIVITIQQQKLLSHYLKTYLVNGIPKKKEHFVNRELVGVTFYKEQETLNEIFNMYPLINHFSIRERIFIGNGYTQIDDKSYSNSILEEYVVSILNQYGHIIYMDDRDINTGLTLGETIKFYYRNNDLLKNYIFSYLENGDLQDVIDENGREWRDSSMNILFGNDWQNMQYYHSASPVIPQ